MNNHYKTQTAKITKAQKDIVKMLSIGTALEYVDACLYIHMSLVISKVFFSPLEFDNWFFANSALCATYFFSPFRFLFIR